MRACMCVYKCCVCVCVHVHAVGCMRVCVNPKPYVFFVRRERKEGAIAALFLLRACVRPTRDLKVEWGGGAQTLF